MNEEQQNIVNDIIHKLDERMEIFKKDFENLQNQGDVIRDGRIQEYVLESENRIKTNLENRINKIQEDVESLIIKFGIGGDTSDYK